MQKRVTMTLTDTDVANVDDVAAKTGARTKAQAISTSLALTRFLVDQLSYTGTKLMIQTPDGETQQIVVPELQKRGRRDTV